MMHFEDATKKQLLHIALFEDCDIDLKYEACRELQLRQWRDEYTLDLVRLWGRKKSAFDISIEMGLDKAQVEWQLQKLGLYGKRVGA